MKGKLATAAGLEYRRDMYGSVYLHSVPPTEAAWAALDRSLEEFESTGAKAVWLKVAPQHSAQVPGLLERGFYFHHAQLDYLMLAKWLLRGRPDNLPKYNTHLCGAGGMVIDEQARKILLVHEKSPIGKKIWKLPGGQVDGQEYVHEAVVREVKEETGVDAEFVSVLACRELKGFRFGATDLYFVCLLRATSTQLRPQLEEVEDVRWWDIEEYLRADSSKTPTYMLIKEMLATVHAQMAGPQRSLEAIGREGYGLLQRRFSLKLGERSVENSLYYSPLLAPRALEKL